MVSHKQFESTLSILEKKVGTKLTYNRWVGHLSIYTLGINNSCQDKLVEATSMRKAFEHMESILNTLRVIEHGPKDDTIKKLLTGQVK